MTGLGFLDQIEATLPSPGSGRGIPPVDYVRTIAYHCAEGGRYLEEIRDLKTDGGAAGTSTAPAGQRVAGPAVCPGQ